MELSDEKKLDGISDSYRERTIDLGSHDADEPDLHRR